MRYGEPEAGHGVVRNRLFQPAKTPCDGGHVPLLGLNVAVTTRTERKPEWRISCGGWPRVVVRSKMPRFRRCDLSCEPEAPSLRELQRVTLGSLGLQHVRHSSYLGRKCAWVTPPVAACTSPPLPFYPSVHSPYANILQVVAACSDIPREARYLLALR